jgi:hypothetical protein
MPDQTGNISADPDAITRARFKLLSDGDESKELVVHFNPQTLQYQLQNNIDQRGNSSASKQYVSQSTAKLSMQLIFDTTDTGVDVRSATEPFRQLMEPKKEGQQRVAQVVQFQWGTYRFKGMFDSYKETIDFFSATGVPLRATADISLSQQDSVFKPNKADPSARGTLALAPPPGSDARNEPLRQVAEQNGVDNLRNLSGGLLFASVDVNLRAAASFASGGIGVSLNAGVDLQLGIGVDISVTGGASGSGGSGAAGGARSSAGPGGVAPSRPALANATATAGASNGGSDGPHRSGPGGAARPAAANARGLAGLLAPPLAAGAVFRAPLASSTFGLIERAKSAFAVQGGLTSTQPQVEGPLWGAAASAGTPALLGAFAGLGARKEARQARQRVDTSALLQKPSERGLHTGFGAAFDVGGRALSRTTDGLTTDVGARASLNDRIRFDEE